MSEKKLFQLEISESELIKGCVDFDRQFQNALYKKLAGRMLVVCFRYSRNREDAEDTLSEGFMKVFEKIGTFRNEGPLEAWVRRIMVNTALEKLRKKTDLYRVLRAEEMTTNYQGSDDIESNLNAKELILLIQKLPPMYQMVFNLYALEGFKHKEIAEKLGISEGTSKSNLSEARAWLRKALQKQSGENKAIPA